MPSITPMMSLILRELSAISCMVETTWPTAWLPRWAAPLAEVASWLASSAAWADCATVLVSCSIDERSEEHTSELQSHVNIVCRLLLVNKQLTFDFTFFPPFIPRASVALAKGQRRWPLAGGFLPSSSSPLYRGRLRYY